MNLTLPLIFRRHRLLGLLAPVFVALFCGCSQREDPEVSISWLAPQTHAAQAANCSMPLLRQPPNADYQQIAIIEVVDDYNADDAEVEGLARSKACETGADALVIVENQKQKAGNGYDSPGTTATTSHTEQKTADVGEAGHKGRILNAVAIVYKTDTGKGKPAKQRD